LAAGPGCLIFIVCVVRGIVAASLLLQLRDLSC
jgi:hypothetical protein